ncbi:MAG: hypothetical protein Alpg2KO_22420 [Alphaproteobacteria bacterium]
MYQDNQSPNPRSSDTGGGAEGKPDAGKNPPVPYLENDSLRNRLIALTNQRFSISTVSGASKRLFMKAMKRLAAPVARLFVLPGEKNMAVLKARKMLATLPAGTKGLFRTDGSMIVASSTEAPLKAARDRKLDLDRAYLVRVNLKRQQLDGIKLTATDMRLGKLDRASLKQATLDGSDLRRCGMEKTILEEASAKGVNFGEATLQRINAKGADLSGSRFTGAILEGCRFMGANLRGADFSGAKFRAYSEGDYYDLRIHDVSFRNADLTGARFDARTNFDHVDLTGAKLDDVVILDRNGNKVEGAYLNEDGSILYTRIPSPPPPVTPSLPGPNG